MPTVRASSRNVANLAYPRGDDAGRDREESAPGHPVDARSPTWCPILIARWRSPAIGRQPL